MGLTQEEMSFLWGRFKEGDATAFGQLCQQHYGLLFNYGTKFSKDRELVKDCLQELFLDLWNNRNQLSHPPFVKAYLLTALRNRMLKTIRRSRPFQPLDDFYFEAVLIEPAWETTLIADEYQAEQVRQVFQGIYQLSKRQQEIIYLRFYQHLEHTEISQIMNLSRASVANLLCRSIKELKRKLSVYQPLLVMPILLQMVN